VAKLPSAALEGIALRHRTDVSNIDSVPEKLGQVNLGMKFKAVAFYAVDLLLLMIVSLTFRLVNLANYPRWYVDEGSYAQLGINITRGIWGYATRWPNFYQPLFPAIQAMVLTLATHDYFWARVSGALIGCVSCLLVYAIGRRVSGRVEALVASVFLAVASAYINRLGLQDNFVEFFLILTVLFYLESEKRSKKWSVLTGFVAGLTFLSKFTGVVAPIYVIVRSINDKRVKANGPAILVFLSIASLHPIIGLLFDWKGFVAETLGIYASRPLDLVDILRLIVLGAPANQLQVASLGATASPIQSPLQLFCVIGFLCALWVLVAEKGENKAMISAWMISVIATLVFSGQVFWARLVYLYPTYGLAIGALFARSQWWDNFSRATRIARELVASPLIWLASLLALTATLWGISFGQLVDKILFFAWLPALYIVGSRLRAQFKPLGRTAILGLILVLLVSASAFQAYQVNANETSDQAGIVRYLNEHTSKTDLVAANTAVTWLLGSVGVDYAEVAFYTTHEPTYTYIPEQLSRFRMNISLWNCKYIVLDTPWLRDKLGGSKSVETLTPIILQTWTRVYTRGDYQVFENRGTSAFELSGIVQTVDFPVEKSHVRI
jgi:4-amino-4-deoxy-L-arabinose transferase-like glycosyltransferase